MRWVPNNKLLNMIYRDEAQNKPSLSWKRTETILRISVPNLLSRNAKQNTFLSFSRIKLDYV